MIYQLQLLLCSTILPVLLLLPLTVLSAPWTRTIVRPLSSCQARHSRLLERSSEGSRMSLMVNLRGGEIEAAKSLDHVKEILSQAEERKQLVVLKFTSKDCEPCRMIAPLYLELSESEEFSNVVFLQVDVEETPDVASFYQVTGWPTFLFWKNGGVQTEIVGGKLAQATLYDWVKLSMPKEE